MLVGLPPQPRVNHHCEAFLNPIHYDYLDGAYAAPVGAGAHGRRQPFWGARGEYWHPPMYFGMDSHLAIHVAKCSCVVMPHAHG